MKIILISLLLLSSCAIPTLQNNCGLIIAGDYKDRLAKTWLTQDELSKGMDAAIKQASIVTDPAFIDQTDNCRALQGYRVYTMKDISFEIAPDRQVYGFTTCAAKLIVIGAPSNFMKTFQGTSIVHQLFHAMQNCSARLPVDDHRFLHEYDNEAHANWTRDHVWQAIQRANGENQ